MFHRYVLAKSTNSVDFDRATRLMDLSLLNDAHEMAKDGQSKLQFIWDYYCQRHVEKYGTYFQPDVDPTWDQPPLKARPEHDASKEDYSPKHIRVLSGAQT
jgi:hypothetical protein